MQGEILAQLRQRPFAELASLPPREKASPGVRGISIFICRRAGENGGVEVTVEVQRRMLLIFSFRSVDGFEAFPDGRIVPFDTSVSDED